MSPERYDLRLRVLPSDIDELGHGRTLARARTLWVPIDRATSKSTDVAADARARLRVPRPGQQ